MIRGFRSMAMDSELEALDRRRTIAAVIAAELERQALVGAMRVDVNALAAAVDTALSAGAPSRPIPDEGRHPDELNATNDD